ncbi:hypothetical protein GWI33_015297 [Rhynchophorus ferrugineus]|uniref:Uncharacterized protein n=1 Tax=Rhynchophorus ferrugineus TaxID=354439 RepID=A0A834I3T7_RHYFE|nr:hypothetical protein GWI33_015297 [Rhynchophorus ferrugineus]
MGILTPSGLLGNGLETSLDDFQISGRRKNLSVKISIRYRRLVSNNTSCPSQITAPNLSNLYKQSKSKTNNFKYTLRKEQSMLP